MAPLYKITLLNLVFIDMFSIHFSFMCVKIFGSFLVILENAECSRFLAHTV